jgi:transposase-like protein
MTAAWEEEYRSFRQRDLSEKDYVYVWADGVHFRVRLEEDRLCTLVLLGVRRDGRKELIAVEDGYLDMAQKRWRRVTAPHLVALVREGVPFNDGTQVRNAA